MTVLLIVLALLLVLLYFAGKYFFDFTFSRQDKPYDWESGLKPDDPITMIRDRAFWDSPEREQVEITSRDGLKLRGLFYDRGGETTDHFCHGYQKPGSHAHESGGTGDRGRRMGRPDQRSSYKAAQKRAAVRNEQPYEASKKRSAARSEQY